MKNTSLKSKRGFTLLLAALVATIVLALASSIFTIAQKQLILSSIGRDSQFAFYAADTGAECALYYDMRFQRFPTSTPTATPQVICDGNPATVQPVATEGTDVVTIFETDLFVGSPHSPGGYCVEVEVRKRTENPTTIIRADGYNVDCAQKDESPRALQRSVELTY
ncbi:MAG TPA: hypothetical protein VJH91_01680 [Candidatus Paceibacterota bacterium]